MPASDSLNRLRHAGGMILTEHGLRLAKEGDHGRSVQRPRLLMLRNGCYRVGGRTFGSLDEALP